MQHLAAQRFESAEGSFFDNGIGKRLCHKWIKGNMQALFHKTPEAIGNKPTRQALTRLEEPRTLSLAAYRTGDSRSAKGLGGFAGAFCFSWKTFEPPSVPLALNISIQLLFKNLKRAVRLRRPKNFHPHGTSHKIS